ncbi:glutathione S-transferase [Marinomonas sp. 15G1-11]|uniref:Glutathione S-transferase n=1 Tax=Marinomonas phaeophyticola TaxID=3004091 RepID=A0ABT4JQC8_9GAMM|nr:glutathione S-transferase [Marinomonas sp. 15G1-11]MCZ2720595.1 glutathione S-transferase [Marinomonas sp. 15G1-11]
MAVLYSFRRCPYAIRARYTLALLGHKVELREVVLKDKPDALLVLGGRSTVPQLVDGDERYQESKDIMFWAIQRKKLEQNGSTIASQLWPDDVCMQTKILEWFDENDNDFKAWLDKYKYADRFPSHSEAFYRGKAEAYLQKLEHQLSKTSFLLGDVMTLADIAVFPFIRQFSAVDTVWFENTQYQYLKLWLDKFLKSDVFLIVMKKYSQWYDGQESVIFP